MSICRRSIFSRSCHPCVASIRKPWPMRWHCCCRRHRSFRLCCRWYCCPSFLIGYFAMCIDCSPSPIQSWSHANRSAERPPETTTFADCCAGDRVRRCIPDSRAKRMPDTSAAGDWSAVASRSWSDNRLVLADRTIPDRRSCMWCRCRWAAVASNYHIVADSMMSVDWCAIDCRSSCIECYCRPPMRSTDFDGDGGDGGDGSWDSMAMPSHGWSIGPEIWSIRSTTIVGRAPMTTTTHSIIAYWFDCVVQQCIHSHCYLHYLNDC